MHPNDIFAVLDLALQIRKNNEIYNPVFISPPGLGKTEIVEQWAKEKGLPSIVMSLATYDPPDLRGFPETILINGKKRMTFSTPDYWPSSGEGLLILEEVNRCPNSIMQCILSLTDKRRGFDGYTLPDGWVIAACINPENSDKYDTVSMDEALKNRFKPYEISYSKEVLLDYAKSKNWNKDLINFIESGVWTYKTPEEIGNTPGSKYISSRTLSQLNAALGVKYPEKLERAIYESSLGINVGKDFYDFRHDNAPVMYNDLIKNSNHSLDKLTKYSDPNNYQGGMISLTVKDILETNKIENDLLFKVLFIIPVDQGTSLIRDLEIKRKNPNLLTDLLKNYPKLKTKFIEIIKHG